MSVEEQIAHTDLHNEQAFSAVLDTMEQQIAVIDMRGNILWVNKAWRSFSMENGGRPDQTWRNVNYLETCNTSASNQDRDAINAEAGIRSVIDGTVPSFHFEYPCHSQCEKRWFMMSMKPMNWDGPPYFVISHLNITNRKLAEIEQEETNKLYEESQKIGRVGSWELDMREEAEGTLSWSKETYGMFEVSPDAAKQVRAAFFDAMHPEDRLAVKNAYKRSLDERKPYEIEYRIVMKDGSEKYLVENGDTKFGAKGRPLISTGTVHDVTARRNAEKEKSDFVSLVSHELRTPITSIRGSLSLANSGRLGEIPSEIQSLLLIAHRNTDRLLLLLKDILDADKIESGKMEFQKKRMNLSLFLREHLELEKGFGDELGVKFGIAGVDHPIWIDGDENRLAQVLANLTSNAAKFSNQGDVVDVSVGYFGASKVRVSVTDKGPGISESQRARVFEKFTQVNLPTQTQNSGTGLGLAIAKLIIEEHGGTIDFTSEIGKGTTFYFELGTVD